MAVLTDVLYGNRLDGTTTYSSNQDAESLLVTLSDSTSMSESMTSSDLQILAEAMSLAEALTKSVNKPLSESISLVESFTKSIAKPFSETMTLGDASVRLATKVLPAITVTGPFPLYGSLLYSIPLYGFSASGLFSEAIVMLESVVSFLATKVLSDTLTMSEQRAFIVARNLSDALQIVDNAVAIHQDKGFFDFILLQDWISVRLEKANIWNVPVSNEETIPLYSQVLYSQSLYGQTPTVVWGNDEPNVPENFTNFDGQGNVP